MGRNPRVHFPGAVYHAMARGVDGMDIYVDDTDRMAFLDGMRRIEQESSARVIAYCLMGNHFHFAIQVGRVPLAVVMHRLLTPYSMRFNRRHERTGHLFQGRYKAIICLDDRYLVGLIRYIHMNPVRAGLVAAAKDWPWSNYEPASDSGEVGVEFDPWPKEAREVDLMRSWEDEAVALEAIGASVAACAGIDLNALRSDCRGRAVVGVRRLFVQETIRSGYSLNSAARWLNVSPRSVSRYAHDNTVRTAGLAPI